MFTGLVEARAPVRRTLVLGTGLRLWIAGPPGFESRVGDSVCVSGACLSVAAIDAADLAFDLTAETLGRTWFRDLRSGDEVNLERAMRLSDRLDGHLVAGHVDGRGRCTEVEDSGDGGRRLSFEVDPGFSVAVDGVSLTVVEPRGRIFDVAAIPITLEKTTLGRAERGRVVNLEADLIGKWIERLVRQ